MVTQSDQSPVPISPFRRGVLGEDPRNGGDFVSLCNNDAKVPLVFLGFVEAWGLKKPGAFIRALADSAGRKRKSNSRLLRAPLFAYARL